MSSCNKCLQCGCGTSHRGLSNNNNSAYLSDLLRMTEQKLLDLQQEAKSSKRTVRDKDDLIAELKAQVASRELEISRLQGLLAGGRSVTAIIEDNRLQAAHAHLHQMQMHIDMLSTNNDELERKLKNVLGDTHDAMNRAVELADENSGLSKTLRNVAKTNRMLEEDVITTELTLSQSLQRTKEHLMGCEVDLSEQHRLYHLMRDERNRLHKDMVMVRHDYSRLTCDHARLVEERGPLLEDNHRMEAQLCHSHEEKKHQLDKINRLTVQVEELENQKTKLIKEGEDLKTTLTNLQEEKDVVEQSKAFFSGETEKLQAEKQEMEEEIKNLDQQKDYFKGEMNKLEEQNRSMEEARDFVNADIGTLQAQQKQMEQERDFLTDQLNQAQSERQQVEREREYYSEQVVQLLDILKSKPTSTPSTPLVGKSRKPLDPEAELAKVTHEREVLRQERDYLKVQLNAAKRQQGQQQLASGSRRSSGPSPPLSSGPLRTSPTLPGSPPTDATIASSGEVENLRRERDSFKKQMEYYRQQASNMPTSRRGSPPDADLAGVRSLSPQGDISALQHDIKMAQQERDFFRQQYENLKSTLGRSSSAGSDQSLSDVIRERDIIQKERDYYRSQYNDITQKMSQSALSPAGPSQALKQEMQSVMAEKKAAVVAKADLEAQIRNLTAKISELERDKNEINSHASELHKAVEKLQDAATKRYPPSTQSFIMDIRKSRDSALADLEKLKKEREELRNKLKMLTSMQMREKASAEEDAKNSRYQNEEGKRTMGEQQQRLQSQGTLVGSLQDQVQSLQDALQLANMQLASTGQEADKYKRVLESKLGELGGTEDALNQRASQLTMAESRIIALESEEARLQNVVAKMQELKADLQNDIQRLDQDKDKLISDLDHKTEQLADTREELKKREATIVEREADLTKLQGKLDATLSTLSGEQRKLQNEEKRSSRLDQDLAAMVAARDAALKEIKRLQSELLLFTQDMKKLKEEFEKVKVSKDNFKRKAQEYCRTLEELTSLMYSKEGEQSDLRKQYLSLNEVVSSLKVINTSLEENLSTRTQDCSKMETMMAKFKEEREQLINQMMESSQRVDELESACSTLEEEKYEIEKELLNTQELAKKLDMSKSQAETEVARMTSTLEKALSEKRNAEAKVAALTQQINSERTALRSMEEALNDHRRSEWSSETTSKQLEMERNQLHRKVQSLKEDLDNEVSEVKRLRARTAQYENEVERLRRELTDERYERERSTQELRRVTRYQKMNKALDELETTSITTSTNLEGTGPLTRTSPHITPSHTAVPSHPAISTAPAYTSNSSVNTYPEHTSAHGVSALVTSPINTLVHTAPSAHTLSHSASPSHVVSYSQSGFSLHSNEQSTFVRRSSGRSLSTPSHSGSVSSVAPPLSRQHIHSKSPPLYSSSSDTGLERSQAHSTSSDSQNAPWKLAFGSRDSELVSRGISNESIRSTLSSHKKDSHPYRPLNISRGPITGIPSTTHIPRNSSISSLPGSSSKNIRSDLPRSSSSIPLMTPGSSLPHSSAPSQASAHSADSDVPSVRPKEHSSVPDNAISRDSDSWG
ncbi:unnamed protein product [Meganyctiphanes norvegica]|uniref:Uncharacterized protein n=1 Tax=Meganyctiphanes norvegica TaxID=48144 RepID=A0AAV2PZ97_MEGNR